jgi:hypothetical protein
MAIDFPDSPTVDQQYSVGDRTWTWNGTYWQLSQTSSTFTASDTAPVNPSAGDIWFESDTGQTFVYYDQSWVEIGAATDLSDILSDADADTSIQVEASSDEDVIRFRTAGTERLQLTSDGHLIPQANVTYDLGSASNRFRDLYLSGSSIDLGGVSITSDGTNISLPNVDDVAANTVTANSVQIGGEYVTPYTGQKNAIINGDMRIAQRGTSVSHTSGGGNSYFHCDRWRGSDFNWSSGNTITRSQSTDAPNGFTHSLKWQNDSNTLIFGSGGSMYIEQRIEGYNASHLYKYTYATLSFWVKSSTAGTYTCHFSNGAFTRLLQKEFNITNADTWEYKSIVIPMASGTSSGTWTTDNSLGIRVQWYIGAHADRTGDDYLDNWGNISNYHYLTSSSVNLATIPNSSFYLTGVQLEVGPQATPFEHLPFGVELTRCQRYYQKSYRYETVPGSLTGAGDAVIFGGWGTENAAKLFYAEHKVSMRATPSLSFWDSVGNASKISTYDTGFSRTDNVNAVGGSGLNADRHYVAPGTSTVNAWLWAYAISAEL